MAVTSFTNSLNQRETLQDFGHEDVNELKYDVRLKMEDSKLENQDSDLKVKAYLQKLAKVKKMKAEKRNPHDETCQQIEKKRKPTPIPLNLKPQIRIQILLKPKQKWQ